MFNMKVTSLLESLLYTDGTSSAFLHNRRAGRHVSKNPLRYIDDVTPDAGLVMRRELYLNPITNGILRFRQLRGRGLFGPDPENKVTVNGLI